MLSPITIYKDCLKSRKVSDTKTRRIVFQALLESIHLPLTMNELVLVVGNKMDRATVYRTIELFEALNIANKTYIGWKYRIELTDAFHEHHHHMTCTACGRIISLRDLELEQKIATLGEKHNFLILEHQLELRGLCDSCR